MKTNSARKISEHENPLNPGNNPYETQRLYVSTENQLTLGQKATQSGKRFRGDLLIYMIAVGIWLFGTVWMVIKLIDSFF